MELAKQNRKELTEYRRKNVGVVFQSYNLIAELTVQENIRVVADIAEHPLALAELMEDLGLSRHAKHFRRSSPADSSRDAPSEER